MDRFTVSRESGRNCSTGFYWLYTAKPAQERASARARNKGRGKFIEGKLRRISAGSSPKRNVDLNRSRAGRTGKAYLWPPMRRSTSLFTRTKAGAGISTKAFVEPTTSTESAGAKAHHRKGWHGESAALGRPLRHVRGLSDTIVGKSHLSTMAIMAGWKSLLHRHHPARATGRRPCRRTNPEGHPKQAQRPTQKKTEIQNPERIFLHQSCTSMLNSVLTKRNLVENIRLKI
ncbi:MAG: hypothetical protein RLZZ165_361 [Bacteroidota bacterium]